MKEKNVFMLKFSTNFQLRKSIIERYNEQWKKVAQHQSKLFFSKNMVHVREVAQILNEAYDLDKLDIASGNKCIFCSGVARKRCSRCKAAWYCGRYFRQWKEIVLLE